MADASGKSPVSKVETVFFGLWRAISRLFAVALLSLFPLGCGDLNYSISRSFDTAALERDLVVGKSTEADVRNALRAPDGVGRYFSPAESAPLVMWAYNHESGTLGRQTRRNLLFVLFRNGRYNGYVWFSDSLTGR